MRSMTGFGKAAAILPDGTEVTVLVRGVNHRFLDVAVKLRDELAPLEPRLRKAVAEAVSRGHVDVVVRSFRPLGRTAAFDEEAAARYMALWREAATSRALPADLSARDILGLPGVVRVEDAGDLDEPAAEALLQTVRKALADFEASKRREGESLAAALDVILVRLERGIDRLDAERTGLTARLEKTLRERIEKLLADVALDETRLVQEAALLAERADISEEVDRFRAHLAEARRLLSEGGAVGKRLDFLAQELHREANTSGSKSRELGTTRASLDLKADVEALKEQIQNVE